MPTHADDDRSPRRPASITLESLINVWRRKGNIFSPQCTSADSAQNFHVPTDRFNLPAASRTPACRRQRSFIRLGQIEQGDADAIHPSGRNVRLQVPGTCPASGYRQHPSARVFRNPRCRCRGMVVGRRLEGHCRQSRGAPLAMEDRPLLTARSAAQWSSTSTRKPRTRSTASPRRWLPALPP